MNIFDELLTTLYDNLFSDACVFFRLIHSFCASVSFL